MKNPKPDAGEKFDHTYRFRCFKLLRLRAERVAKVRGYGDASDIGREGVISLIENEEKRFQLPPLDHSEIRDPQSAIAREAVPA